MASDWKGGKHGIDFQQGKKGKENRKLWAFGENHPPRRREPMVDFALTTAQGGGKEKNASP